MFAEMISEMKAIAIIEHNSFENILAKDFSFEQIEMLSKSVTENNINKELKLRTQKIALIA